MMNEPHPLAVGVARKPGGRRTGPPGCIDAEIVDGACESARGRPYLTVYDPNNVVSGRGIGANEIVDLGVHACDLVANDDACINLGMGSHNHSGDIEHLVRFRRRNLSDGKNDLET